MSGKDVLRLLLISYGFCRNIEINTYMGNGGWIGYEVSANMVYTNELVLFQLWGLLG